VSDTASKTTQAGGPISTPEKGSAPGPLQRFVDHPWFQNTILGVIILNALVLGLEAIPEARAAVGHGLLLGIDYVILWIFVAEIVLRMAAHRLRFFTDAWSLFDLAVVAVSLLAVSGLQALRAFRVFRVLRVLSALPRLRSVMNALLDSIPGIAWVGAILVIILFVAAVIATKLFGESFPEMFGDLFVSMFTLFTIMTLEGWPDKAERVIDVYPYAWIFFVSYILVATLTMLNLFVAIIVNAMENEALGGQATKQSQEELLTELKALRGEVQDLRTKLDEKG